MASKTWRLRSSWSLDELAEKIGKHYGYTDRTAFLKSAVRFMALLGHEAGCHTALKQLAAESPGRQDRIDAELLRLWDAQIEGRIGELRKAIDSASRTMGGVSLEELVIAVGQDVVSKLRK